MRALTPEELAFLAALLRLPAAAADRHKRLGTDTSKSHRRALTALRKAHPDDDALWTQEFTLRPYPTRRPNHGAQAALAYLRGIWDDPIVATADLDDGNPTDPFFVWASESFRQCGCWRTPGALLHVYRNLPSIPL